MVSGRPADLGFNTVNQISLIADSLAELKKIHVSLKGRKDVAELRTVTHGNAVSIYFRDPLLLLLYFEKERVVNTIPAESSLVIHKRFWSSNYVLKCNF